MRKTITLSLLSFLFAFTITAQQRSCGTMQDLENRMQQDSGLAQRMADIESFTARKVQELETSRISGNIITIPVVVHVLYRASSENISNEQIQSQLNVLNRDYRRTNSDRNNVWSQAADAQIEFCLAKVDPSGRATSGITRKYSSKTEWSSSANRMKNTSQGGVSPWDTRQYLNMWVVNKISGGTLGYAQFPGGSRATDGVVMGHEYFGSTGTAKFPYNKGRTTTHEVGHFLNLRHIWGDGACGASDYVSDTPSAEAANYGCSTNKSSCGSRDMVQNYMDYSDDACMNLFTSGQKNRMRAVLLSGGSRSSLGASNKCEATSTGGGTTSGGNCDRVAAYNSSTSYSVGAKVVSNGTLYQRTSSGWSNLGACTSTGGGTTSGDKCAGVAAYNSSTSYSVGAKVVSNATLYQRTSSGWSNLGACGSSRIGDDLDTGFPGDELKISVYPNPVRGNTLHVKSNNTNVPFTIVNMLGQRVSQGSNVSNGVNVSNLDAGLYLIQFRVNDTIKTKKFIKE